MLLSLISFKSLDFSLGRCDLRTSPARTSRWRWNFRGAWLGPGHPGMLLTALCCSHRGENHLFPLEKGLLPPGALPPHPGSGPSCRVSMSTEGMNLLRLKILCFYLDEKKNLACLHWHTKIGSVWVNLQSFSWCIYLALLFFFLNLSYKFIYRVSFFPPTLSRHLQKVVARLVQESWNNLQGLWNIIVLHSCDQRAAVAWTYHILMWMSG